MKRGILLVGHGSRNKKADIEFQSLVERFKADHVDCVVLPGFLEFQKPSLKAAYRELVNCGVDEITVLPVFLFTGVHLQTDIPLILHELMQEYPSIPARMASHIGVCAELITACSDILNNNLKLDFGNDFKMYHFLMVGVGTSVEKANKEFYELYDDLVSSHGFKSAEYAFISKVVGPSLESVLQKGFDQVCSKIILLPILLFSGMYSNQIKNLVEKYSSNENEIISIDSILSSNNAIVNALSNRIFEVWEGRVNMLSAPLLTNIPRRKFD